MNTWTCDRCGRLIQCHNHSLLQSFIDLHRCAQATPPAEAVEHLDRMARHKAPEKMIGSRPITEGGHCGICNEFLWDEEANVHMRARHANEFSRNWATKQNYDLLLLSESDSEMLKEMAIGI